MKKTWCKKSCNTVPLKKLYYLHKEINRIERNIFNIEFYEWNGFVKFKKLRDEFWELYKEFDTKEDFTDLEFLEQIIDDDFTTFEFDNLTEDERKKLTSKEWDLTILDSEEKNYPHCILKFKDIDEAIDYVLK
jgi:hypothetical protein